jgi:tellurite resistance protein TerC
METARWRRWAWRGGGAARSYLLGYLIEKSLSVDNVFVFAVIFPAFAIPPRYQHRVLILGIIGTLIMRGAFIAAGVALLDKFHAVSYLFGAVLVFSAVRMARGGDARGGQRQPRHGRVARALARILPATDQAHGQSRTVPATRTRQRSLGPATWTILAPP